MRDDDEPLDVYQSKQEMLSRSLSLCLCLFLWFLQIAARREICTYVAARWVCGAASAGRKGREGVERGRQAGE